jgi:hypothetical protein
VPDNVNVTPGAGAPIRSKDIGGIQTQITQLDVGGQGAELQLVGDAVFGLPVFITKFPAAAVLVNNPTAANLKVDASGATVPISAAAAIPVGALSTAPVAFRLSNGTIFVDTIPVSGTVTGNQGAPNATLASAWPVKVSDGTTVAAVDAGSGGLKVAIVAGGGGGVALADLAAFVLGTTDINPMGAVYSTAPTTPTTGQVMALLGTIGRGLQVNLRNNAGTEIGTAGLPLRVDPVGTTPQPVSGTVTAKLQDNTGTAYGPANPLFVVHGGRAFARVTKSLAIAASATGTAAWTPTTGKAFYITKLLIALSVGGTLTLFDGTNAPANIVSDGTMPVGYFPVNFDEPWPSAAINNILKYTTGAGITGTLTAHGFEV